MSPLQLLGLKVGAAALALGILLGGWVAHAFYSPRLELAEARSETLAAEIETQNAAVETLSKDAKAREERAREALAAAESARVGAERRAHDLLAMAQPQGVDACVAASALIRRELGK